MKYVIISLIIIIVIVFRRLIINLPLLIYYVIHDIIHYEKKLPYGCWFFVGRQGSGKTISLVKTLDNLKEKYPNVKIYTNFSYVKQDGKLGDIYDITDKNLYGDYGTIFAIDEIQNEFSATRQSNFPVEILSTVTQQRKQQILILTTSQVFTRVSKPLREQAFRVIECSTYLGRYTVNRHFDGIDYADTLELSPDTKTRRRPTIYYYSFVQNNKIRSEFNTFEVIKRLKRGE